MRILLALALAAVCAPSQAAAPAAAPSPGGVVLPVLDQPMGATAFFRLSYYQNYHMRPPIPSLSVSICA